MYSELHLFDGIEFICWCCFLTTFLQGSIEDVLETSNLVLWTSSLQKRFNNVSAAAWVMMALVVSTPIVSTARVHGHTMTTHTLKLHHCRLLFVQWWWPSLSESLNLHSSVYCLLNVFHVLVSGAFCVSCLLNGLANGHRHLATSHMSHNNKLYLGELVVHLMLEPSWLSSTPWVLLLSLHRRYHEPPIDRVVVLL